MCIRDRFYTYPMSLQKSFVKKIQLEHALSVLPKSLYQYFSSVLGYSNRLMTAAKLPQFFILWVRMDSAELIEQKQGGMLVECWVMNCRGTGG